MQMYVPVVGKTGKPLMPTTNRKADKLIAKGRARRRFDRGLFYIQLLDREHGYTQPIAVGVDPGSKKEGFSVKSHAHTYLNIQADAVTWVKDAEKTSTQMRRSRRSRKTPYRQCRRNRRQGQFRLPPSTRARWGWKVRICQWVARRFPITTFIVEDIAAVTRPGKQRFNRSFSPLEVGKHWFYAELVRIASICSRPGWHTAGMREELGLKKSRNKLSDNFDAHCVDSWVLANFYTGGHLKPDNMQIIYLVPLHFHRRQLHRLEPAPGGKRAVYGGTRSLGFKRGSWIKHPKYGVCYVGGTTGATLSLHDMQTGTRMTKSAKPADVSLLCTASWRVRAGRA